MALKVGDQIELHIESLSYGGGRGVGRHQGFVFFIPYSAPGDEILAEITFLKKSFGEAKIIKIIKASPYRTQPLCPSFGECGGCRFQHVTYEEQLRQKDRYIEKALKGVAINKIHQIIPSPKPFHYRNRIQVHVRGDQFGFLEARSARLVPISGCHIAEEPIHSFLSSRKLGSKVTKKKVELALDQRGQLHLRGVEESALFSQFSQVNRFQNANLVEKVLDWAKQSSDQSGDELVQVLDLYAGSGNLSFPLNEALKLPVVAVELSQTAVAKAKENAPRAQPVTFKAESVESYLKNFTADTALSNTLVVSDPPREGLTKNIIQKLVALRPPFIIHVGCDLMNFARDLRLLSDSGYEVQEVQPLDMFPQTDHVELIAWIRDKAS